MTVIKMEMTTDLPKCGEISSESSLSSSKGANGETDDGDGGTPSNGRRLDEKASPIFFPLYREFVCPGGIYSSFSMLCSRGHLFIGLDPTVEVRVKPDFSPIG
jgi:hypothetical protein